MVDFFAYSCDLAVLAELPDDVLVEFALTEWKTLVDRDLRIGYDVIQTKRSEFIPFVLCSF